MFEAGQHIRLMFEEEYVIATTVAEQRRLSRLVLSRAAGFELLCFNSADTHLHLEIPGSAARADELVRRIKISWRRQFPEKPPLIAKPHRPMLHMGHMYNSFYYILDQRVRHGCEEDPFHEGSALADLLKLRVTGGYLIVNKKRWLQRVSDAELKGRLGAVDLDLPFDSLESLAEAAAAAVALPDLRGSDVLSQAAKSAAVRVASPHLNTVEIAAKLELSSRQVNRLRKTSVDQALFEAVDRQLRLRCQVANRPRNKPGKEVGLAEKAVDRGPVVQAKPGNGHAEQPATAAAAIHPTERAPAHT